MGKNKDNHPSSRAKLASTEPANPDHPSRAAEFGSDESCQVFHFDLYGTRQEKYDYLQSHDLKSIEWQQLEPQAPNYFFVPKDFSLQEEYEKGFRIDELMKVNAAGIKTHHDAELISTQPFKIENNQRYLYRILDTQWINYDLQKVERHRYSIMRHMLQPNLVLNVSRQCISDWRYVFVSDGLTDINYIASAGKLGGGNVFPLYLYPEAGSIETERRANMDEGIVKKIMERIGRTEDPSRAELASTERITELAIFDYIYGVLHSPAYRQRYKEFLKIDFPRIPYPKDAADFEHYNHYGYQLRELHLMHTPPSGGRGASFPIGGDSMVSEVRFDAGGDDRAPRVYINGTQYFDNVPREAWEMLIGGYQPAQKWLKDRKGRALTFDDIQHYCGIIGILQDTATLMEEIG